MRNLENKYPNKLKDLRINCGLSQKEVSAAINLIGESRICRWERGQSYPGLNNLIKLAKLYKVSVEEIYQSV